jgi:type IV pilus assembly protein PilM
MPTTQGVWGIDVGQSALKALRMEVIDGVPTATAFDYVEHPKILSQPDADPDQLTREALEKFLSRNSLKGDLVAISVPGQSGLARFVKLPPVEEKKIIDIVRFEAKQQIPFPLDEVVWDFQKIGSGEVTDGFAMETEIGLFAMKRDQISRALSHFQDVNVEVHYIQMAPLALCNFVAYDLLNKGGPAMAEAPPAEDEEGGRGKRRCVVALDIGTDSSNLVITDGEKIIWQRPIPLGGNHLTRALSKELKLTFAKAEHLKRNAAKSPPELKTILSALKPVLTDFVGEVQRSLGFFANSHRDSQIQYMVGLGSAFRLPGLQKYLSEKLQLDVRKPVSMNRLLGDEVVNAPVFTENVLSFAVPYGLAIQGLGLSKLKTNLMPQEIQRDRMIRAKKPWAVAAASALFLGAGLLATGYAINYNAVSAKSIQSADAKAKQMLDRVGTLNTSAKQKEDEVRQLTDQVKGVIAGKDEQKDWLLLNAYINRCLPNPEPNGGNLKSTDKWLDDPNVRINQTVYWNTNEARNAMEQYKERIAGGQSADQPIPEEIREHLPLVDVESIHGLYSDNLKTFFEKAERESDRASGVKLDGMLKYDRDNPPKDNEKGWVIEIRGTTWKKESRKFIIDSLVHNLTHLERGTLPVTGSAPPPAETPDAPKDEMYAIRGRISHVFLFTYLPDHDPKPGTFTVIGRTLLPPLVAGAGPAAPAGGETGLASNVASGRDGWKPLTGSGGGGGGGATFGSPPGPASASMGAPTGTRGKMGGGTGFSGATGDTTVGTSGAFGGGATPSGANLSGKKGKPRYEFIVMFIWREPTPSDALMKSETPAQ